MRDRQRDRVVLVGVGFRQQRRIRTAERVHRLRGVPGEDEVCGPGAEFVDQPILQRIQVLRIVDEYVSDPLPLGGKQFRLRVESQQRRGEDRKSTRLNSSHVSISYAVFCLKTKT